MGERGGGERARAAERPCWRRMQSINASGLFRGGVGALTVVDPRAPSPRPCARGADSRPRPAGSFPASIS